MSDDGFSPTRPTPHGATGAGMDRRIGRGPRPFWRKPLWQGAAVAGVLAIAAIVRFTPAAGSLRVDRSQVEFATVARAPFQDYLPVRAEAAPIRTVFIGAVSGGQVERVVAQDGAVVATGEVLAELSNPQLKLDVSAREAEISGRIGDTIGADLNLETSRAAHEREIADAEYHRVEADQALAIRQKLRELGLVSDAYLKPYSDAADYYRAQTAALKASFAKSEAAAGGQAQAIQDTAHRLAANLKAVHASLDALTLKAPVSGRLTNFTIQPGQTLKVGDPIGQIDSEGEYKLVADVDEFFLSRVRPGLPAKADPESGGAAPKSPTLVVSRVLPQVTGGRFRTELTFTGPPPANLKRGESMSVRITFSDPRPALVVENGAWLETGGGTWAFVLDKDGRTAERRAIRLGRRNPEQAEVLEGLSPGDRVIASSYAGYETYRRLILK
jgi:HlyD family secretion protein